MVALLQIILPFKLIFCVDGTVKDPFAVINPLLFKTPLLVIPPLPDDNDPLFCVKFPDNTMEFVLNPVPNEQLEEEVRGFESVTVPPTLILEATAKLTAEVIDDIL